MNPESIIKQFENGELLIKIILSMQNFFIKLDNTKYISEKKDEILFKNKNITLTKLNKTYYLDVFIYLN